MARTWITIWITDCINTLKAYLPEKKSVVELNGLCLNVHGGPLSPPQVMSTLDVMHVIKCTRLSPSLVEHKNQAI